MLNNNNNYNSTKQAYNTNQTGKSISDPTLLDEYLMSGRNGFIGLCTNESYL